jgi:hypothetical protein
LTMPGRFIILALAVVHAARSLNRPVLTVSISNKSNFAARR